MATPSTAQQGQAASHARAVALAAINSSFNTNNNAYASNSNSNLSAASQLMTAHAATGGAVMSYAGIRPSSKFSFDNAGQPLHIKPTTRHM